MSSCLWGELGLDGSEDLAEPGRNGRKRAQAKQGCELREHEAVAGAGAEASLWMNGRCVWKQDATWSDVGLECQTEHCQPDRISPSS